MLCLIPILRTWNCERIIVRFVSLFFFFFLSWDFEPFCVTEVNYLSFFDLLFYHSLEDAYEALRVFQILGIEEKNTPVNEDTCQKVVESLASSSPLKDLFYALKVNAILKCNVNGNVFKVLFFYFFLLCLQFECHCLWKFCLCAENWC